MKTFKELNTILMTAVLTAMLSMGMGVKSYAAEKTYDITFTYTNAAHTNSTASTTFSNVKVDTESACITYGQLLEIINQVEPQDYTVPDISHVGFVDEFNDLFTIDDNQKRIKVKNAFNANSYSTPPYINVQMANPDLNAPINVTCTEHQHTNPHTITVSTDGNGTASSDLGSGDEGTDIKLSATPNSGYKFKEWQVISGGVSLENKTVSSTTFTMGTSDVEVKAIFTLAETYTVTVSDDGHGTVTADPKSGDTGTKVTITATPNSKKYKFKKWEIISGEVSDFDDKTNSKTTFKIGNTDVEIKAYFEKNEENKNDNDNEKDKHHRKKSTSSGDSTPPNPDALSIIYLVNEAPLPSVAAGKQMQGPFAQLLFKQARTPGINEAFSFNLAIDGKVDGTLKNGRLILFIPSEYRKAGRPFAITALDKAAIVHFYPDLDTSDETITVDLNIEGFAFDLVYAD